MIFKIPEESKDQAILLDQHQCVEVPARGEADLGEALDGDDTDEDLEDEDSNTVEDIIALEP